MKRKELEILIGELIKEELDMATVDGTPKSATTDQKMKAKKELDAGGSVKFKKKGEPISETKTDDVDGVKGKTLNLLQSGKNVVFVVHSIDRDTPKYISDQDDSLKVVINGDKVSFIYNEGGLGSKEVKSADKETTKYLKSLAVLSYKKKNKDAADVKESEDELNENDLNPGQPTEINVAEAIDSAISSLSQTSESTENTTYKRLAEKTLRILNTAKEAYSKLAEKMSLDEEKDSDKHVEQVKKHIGKKIKDKKDLEPIMSKYHKVAKKLSSVTKDPVKTADALWKHILKEHKNI